jgi:rhodanese-related sulfurtransferase/DNA-binding transcriptional ArsR family regulator
MFIFEKINLIIMSNREFKDNIYLEISRISKAISSPNRLEIIDFIANGKKCVEDIALQTGISLANASQHLQILKKERLVKVRKIGVQVYYSLVSDEVYKVWKSLRDLTLSISPYIHELMNENRDKYMEGKLLSMDEIIDRDDVYLIDVRPKDEYNTGHIPNATSIPIQDLNIRLAEIPKGKLVITYCRGMFCSVADEAIKILHSKGFKAKKIEESVMDYQIEAGLQ